MARTRLNRYELLRRIRKRQEDMKANILAIAERDVLAAHEQLHAIEHEQKEIMRRAEVTPDALEIDRCLQYERQLGRQAIESGAAIETLKGRAHERRLELGEAMKQRKIIDRLIERAVESDKERNRRHEQRGFDEAASIRSALSRAELRVKGREQI